MEGQISGLQGKPGKQEVKDNCSVVYCEPDEIPRRKSSGGQKGIPHTEGQLLYRTEMGYQSSGCSKPLGDKRKSSRNDL